MSEEVVVRQCAPTLAGIKTGSLFPCPYDSKEAAREDIRSLNRRLVPKGLSLLPLRYTEKCVLLYLYRPKKLQMDLANRLAAQMLEDAGYSGKTCAQRIAHLIHRLQKSGEFPHEIGLFLSYPPEDVKGFIDNKAECFKCSGLWKVYGDEQRARTLFAQYKRCTNSYCARWRAGSSIEQLTVAVF